MAPAEMAASSGQHRRVSGQDLRCPRRAHCRGGAGVFTLDSTGKGPAAALNQDGSINTASSAAKVGDIISLFATGEGQTVPAGVDGKLALSPLPTPRFPVSVTLAGQTVDQLYYVGGAPCEVAGVLQINVQIPNGIQTGNAVPVIVRVGSASSAPGVTISVR
jgi:uncharacterized protein (TIGR03437 family)